MSDLIYAKKISNGEIVSIGDIPFSELGLSCGCVCPVCNEPLEACALNSEKVSPYFRHHTDKGCNVSFVNESALHQMAKKVIRNNACILLPRIDIPVSETSYGEYPDGVTDLLPRSYQYAEEGVSMYSFVDEEYFCRGVRVDSVINTPRFGDVFIEFAVTHFVDAEKLNKVKECEKPLLEFDLSLYKDSPVSYEILERFIIAGKGASWKCFPNSVKEKAEGFYSDFIQTKQFRDDAHKNKKTGGNQEEKQKKTNGVKAAILSQWLPRCNLCGSTMLPIYNKEKSLFVWRCYKSSVCWNEKTMFTNTPLCPLCKNHKLEIKYDDFSGFCSLVCPDLRCGFVVKSEFMEGFCAIRENRYKKYINQHKDDSSKRGCCNEV